MSETNVPIRGSRGEEATRKGNGVYVSRLRLSVTDVTALDIAGFWGSGVLYRALFLTSSLG